MRRPSLRLTVRSLMVTVAVAAWLSFNGRLIWGLLGSDFIQLPLPSGGTARIFLFTALALVISPTVAALLFWLATWTIAAEPRGTRILGWIIGSAAAGFAGWSSAALLLCIGQGANGQTPLAAILMGMIGAAIQIIPAALIAGVKA